MEKKYISLETACNIPLPPISYDEEILLSLDINNLYVKKILNIKDYKVSELNISENKEADEGFKKLCSIFKNKCMNCHSYKRFILDLCIINANIYTIIVNAFSEVNKNNKIKINEIYNILKKPKIKPVNVNKLYTDLPNILEYILKFDCFLF